LIGVDRGRTLKKTMVSSALQYEIREIPDREGGLAFELLVEGSRLGRASASVDILADMHAMLGMDREAVATTLRTALVDYLKHQLATVTVSEPVEDSQRKLRFASRFTLRQGDHVQAGVVWYDVTESTTGPDSLPAVVRNKMRHEVHRKLTEPGSAARALVDPHE
jgi:hypothetical protein